MKKPPTELINLAFSSIMVTLTLAGFFVFTFTSLMSERVYRPKRYVLAFLFLVYACYRSYRMYKALKSPTN